MASLVRMRHKLEYTFLVPFLGTGCGSPNLLMEESNV